MGGTLTPALMDEQCESVLAIDLRPGVTADSRGANYDYSAYSTEAMMTRLRSQPSLDLTKLRTFDGTAAQCDYRNEKFELAFIDAEHTDEAVFADFLAIYDHLKQDAICAFHDTGFMTTGIENIISFLKYHKRPFEFLPFGGSSVSALLLDQAGGAFPGQLRGDVRNWEEYKDLSRDSLLAEALKNRITVSYTLKPKPVIPIRG